MNPFSTVFCVLLNVTKYQQTCQTSKKQRHFWDTLVSNWDLVSPCYFVPSSIHVTDVDLVIDNPWNSPFNFQNCYAIRLVDYIFGWSMVAVVFSFILWWRMNSYRIKCGVHKISPQVCYLEPNIRFPRSPRLSNKLLATKLFDRSSIVRQIRSARGQSGRLSYCSYILIDDWWNRKSAETMNCFEIEWNQSSMIGDNPNWTVSVFWSLKLFRNWFVQLPWNHYRYSPVNNNPPP